MSYHPEWASRSPFLAYPSSPLTSDFEQKVALVAILLIFGGFGLSLLASWPSTTQRLIWEALIFLTPGRLVYTIEYAVVKCKGLPGEEPKFRPEHFGNHQAKVEAIQRILRMDNSQLTTTFQRVRAFSGISKIIGRAQPSHPSGLGNWDNSCYQNSVLQGLASLPAFRSFISHSLERMGEQDETSTHHSLQDIIGSLNATENQARTLWTPSALKSMDSWQQQDAQEYFSKLMDTLEEEISKAVKRQKLSSGFEAVAQTPRWANRKILPLSNPLEGLLAQRVACKQCGHSEGLSLLPFNCLTINMGRQYEYDVEELLDEHTALENIEGVECIKCTLLDARSQLERLLSKPTSPETSDESTNTSRIKTIAEARLAAIQEVFDEDSFSESGILKRCSIPAKNQVSSVKSKQVALARSPKSLVIHINRSIFDDFGNQRKNTASVRFPPILDLGRWCLGVKSSSAEIKEFEHWSMTSTESILPLSEEELLDVPRVYGLRCVITHYGRHENGHYVAYGKRQASSTPTIGDPGIAKVEAVADQWYCFNDEVVTSVPADDVLDRGNVFMLFYEAVERPQITQPSSIMAEQKVADAPTKTLLLNDIERAEETDEIAMNTGKAADNGSLDCDREERGAEDVSGQLLESACDHNESVSPQSRAAPGKALAQVPGRRSTDQSPTDPGLTPVMRTAKASPVLSRMERREGNFAMPSRSIIPAI